MLLLYLKKKKQNITELPKNLEYDLRLRSEIQYGSDDKKPYYYREGFLPIQHAIARAFIKQKRANELYDEDLPEVLMRQYPDIINELDSNWLGNLLGVCLLLAFSVFILNTVHHIVMEKERHLKDVLHIIGVSRGLYWLSWCARTMVYLVASTTIAAGVLKVVFQFIILQHIFVSQNIFVDKSVRELHVAVGFPISVRDFNDNILLHV